MDYRARRQSGLSLQPILKALLGLVTANLVLFVMVSGGLAWQAHLGGWLAGWVAGHSFARR